METTGALDTLVQKHPFLTGCGVEFCRFFSEGACVRRFASRQEIFQEGAEADHCYLICNGVVELSLSKPDGGVILVQTLGGGDILGFSWLFPPHHWHFTATTRTPTEVVSFGASRLRARAEEDHNFGYELVFRVGTIVLQRLQSTQLKLIQSQRAAGGPPGVLGAPK